MGGHSMAHDAADNMGLPPQAAAEAAYMETEVEAEDPYDDAESEDFDSDDYGYGYGAQDTTGDGSTYGWDDDGEEEDFAAYDAA